MNALVLEQAVSGPGVKSKWGRLTPPCRLYLTQQNSTGVPCYAGQPAENHCRKGQRFEGPPYVSAISITQSVKSKPTSPVLTLLSS